VYGLELVRVLIGRTNWDGREDDGWITDEFDNWSGIRGGTEGGVRACSPERCIADDGRNG